MADEATDSSNMEQVGSCLRWVDEKLETQEELIGLYAVDSIDAKIFVQVIKNVPLRLNCLQAKPENNATTEQGNGWS